MNQFGQQIHAAIRAAQRGALVNALLAAVKVITGVAGNSYALIADGIESGADVLSSLVVWRGLTISKREASEHYPFGYGKAETVSAAIVALMLLGAAAAIFVAAIREIATPHHLPEPFTLPVLLGVIVTKEFLFRKVVSVGEQTGSASLKGDAWHHRSDAISSAAAFVGISIGLVGGPGWEAADDYAALMCAIIIAVTGLNLLRGNFAELMDRAPSRDVLDSIAAAASAVPEVVLVEKIFARKSGLGYFVDLHVHADPGMSLFDAHIVSGKVKTAIRRALPAVQGVMVHMEPAESEHEE